MSENKKIKARKTSLSWFHEPDSGPIYLLFWRALVTSLVELQDSVVTMKLRESWKKNFFRWIKHGVSFMTDKLQQHQYNTGREHHGAQLSIKLPKWSLKRTQMAKKVPTEAQISKHWPTWIVEHMHLKHDVFAFFSPFSPIQSMHHWFQNDCGGDIESNGWPFCGIYPNPTKPRIPV